MGSSPTSEPSSVPQRWTLDRASNAIALGSSPSGTSGEDDNGCRAACYAALLGSIPSLTAILRKAPQWCGSVLKTDTGIALQSSILWPSSIRKDRPSEVEDTQRD